MFKWLRKLIFRLLIVCILIAGGFVTYGYMLYRDTVTEKSIEKRVEEYWKMSGYLPYNALNPDFVDAVVAVEDKRYFTRTGFDFVAFTRAMITNARFGTREAGSTITQQVAKNLLFDQETEVVQKIAEVFAMYEMESLYSKEDILSLYVNMNYYGDGYYGVGEASTGYFGIPQKDMSLAQAVMLAGLPQSPSVYQLSSGYNLAKERQIEVLEAMVRNGYITEHEKERALMEDLGYE